MIAGPRQCGKIWKSCKRQVHAKGSGASLPCLHPRRHSLWYRLTWQKVLKEILWIDVGDHRTCSSRGPVLQHDTHSAVAFNDDFADFRAYIDASAMFDGDARDGLRDRTHAPDRIAPDG